MRKLTGAILAALLLAPMLSSSGLAEERGERGERWHGDLHRFRDHDEDFWRRGSWFHGRHEGRNGWWWRVGPYWYFYPAPIYPYPDPLVPPAVAVPGPPRAQPVWYYCARPDGYYPYVARCRVPWQPVAPPPR
jgi:hypothetical protein